MEKYIVDKINLQIRELMKMDLELCVLPCSVYSQERINLLCLKLMKIGEEVHFCQWHAQGQELISEEVNNAEDIMKLLWLKISKIEKEVLYYSRHPQLTGNDPSEVNNSPDNVYNGDIPTEPKEKGGKKMTFPSFIYWTLINIPPSYHAPLLLLCGGYLMYQAKNYTDPFDVQFGNSKASQSQPVLSLKEACSVFFTEMAHVTKFMLSYVLTLILILPLHPGVQIFFMLVLIAGPVHYFPELARKASGIYVTSSSLKLPLFWVTFFGGIALSVICVLLAMVMLYLSWRFIHKGRPKLKEIEVDGLSEIILGV